MTAIARMAREAQPGILIVDRTVHGPFENYQTPEQTIPSQKLDNPWESCMTLGGAWGYIPGDRLKSSRRVIHALIEIVAKGGSLLLGVGPKPDGTLPDEVVKRFEEIGSWMHKNGEAIYNTRTVNNYRDGNIFFTQNKSKNLKYALVCLPDTGRLPPTVEWKDHPPVKGSTVKLLETNENIRWSVDGNKTIIRLPQKIRRTTGNLALAFSFVSD
jgi:alpha-L-fucosidase